MKRKISNIRCEDSRLAHVWEKAREKEQVVSKFCKMDGGTMKNRKFQYPSKSISSHILRVEKYSGHLKMMKNVTENFQKSPKLKI